MQRKSAWARVIGEGRNVVIEAVAFDDDTDDVGVSCRLRKGGQRCCGQCGRRCGRYLGLVGPVYERSDDPCIIGLELDERHRNSRGFCHAGVLVARADTIMGHTIDYAATQPARPVTVTLTGDFIGSARSGDWLEGHATIRRAGRRLALATWFRHRDALVFTASAIFGITP